MTSPATVTTTPAFIGWAIEQRCDLRDIDLWRDPQRIERQLRPLRAYCDAVAEDRIFEGVCIAATVRQDSPFDPTTVKGFRADEILDAYGGLNGVQALCGNCPANALQKNNADILAGCYGLLEVEGLETTLHEAIETAVAGNNWQDAFDEEFLPTVPRWQGFWVESPLTPQQVQRLEQLLTTVSETNEALGEKLREILAALKTSRETNLPLYVSSVPASQVVGDKWIVAAHCRRCYAARETPSRRCQVCGSPDSPLPACRRNVRGDRPYWRLSGFLGKENVEPFLQRYLRHKNPL